jgi:hypothetical protein
MASLASPALVAAIKKFNAECQAQDDAIAICQQMSAQAAQAANQSADQLIANFALTFQTQAAHQRRVELARIATVDIMQAENLVSACFFCREVFDDGTPSCPTQVPGFKVGAHFHGHPVCENHQHVRGTVQCPLFRHGGAWLTLDQLDAARNAAITRVERVNKKSLMKAIYDKEIVPLNDLLGEPGVGWLSLRRHLFPSSEKGAKKQ